MNEQDPTPGPTGDPTRDRPDDPPHETSQAATDDPAGVVDDTGGGDSGDAYVRALLAELGRDPAPVPADVVARLDDTLATLAAERAGGGIPVPADPDVDGGGDVVVPLRAGPTPRGVSRWASRTTAAAAAVIVLAGGGVAAATFGLLDPGAPTAGSAGSAGSESAAQSDATAESEAGGRSGSTEVPGAPPDSEDSTDLGVTPLPNPLAGTMLTLPALESATFTEDVEALLGRVAASSPQPTQQGEAQAAPDDATPRPDDPSAPTPAEPRAETRPDEEGRGQKQGQGLSGTARTGSCPGPENRAGSRRDVLVDGRRAVLLVRPERAGRQVVEAWFCSGSRILAVTSLDRR